MTIVGIIGLLLVMILCLVYGWLFNAFVSLAGISYLHSVDASFGFVIKNWFQFFILFSSIVPCLFMGYIAYSSGLGRSLTLC